MTTSPAAAAYEGTARLRLLGCGVLTDFPFASKLPRGSEDGKAPVDLTFRVAGQPVLSPLSASLVYASPSRNGAPQASLFRSGAREILHCREAGDFLIETERIDVFLEGARLDLAELRFLGPVMSYWLERQGLPTLHASAVAVNGSTIAFLSRHYGGKSGLAAALVQAGFPLLTDDLLALEETEDRWMARPSYPEMRMWPDEAAHFVGPPESLPLVQADSEKRRVAVGSGGFGSFLDASTPLARIYLASRRPEGDGDVEILPVSRSEALIELVRHSFSPRLVEAAGLQPARLDRLARLVRSVPVRRLVYPSGFDRLPEIVKLLRQ